jgi:hypothetical protein
MELLTRYKDNSQVLMLAGLADAAGAAVNSAAVEAALLDSRYAPAGASWPLVGIGGGNYAATIGPDLSLDEAQRYYLRVTAVADGLRAERLAAVDVRRWFV